MPDDITCIFCINPAKENPDEIYKHFDDFFDYITLNALFSMFWLYCVIPFIDEKNTEYSLILNKATSGWDEDAYKQVKDRMRGVSYHELHQLIVALKWLENHTDDILEYSRTCEIPEDDKSHFEKQYEKGAVRLAALHYLVEHNFFADLRKYLERLEEGDIFIISVGG